MKLLYTLIILFAYVFPNSDSIKAYDEGDSLVYNINIGEQILITMIDGKEYYGSLYSNLSGNNSFQLKYNPKKHATFFTKRKFNYDEIKFIQAGEGVIEKKYLIAGISGATGLYLSTYIFMFPGSCGICGPQGGLPAIYIRTFFAIGGLIGGIAQEYAIDLPESYGNRLRITNK
tara:strand:+ start:5 stop:526 length:522 start_codon:yes stop_codon:yes gene_type:complete